MRSLSGRMTSFLARRRLCSSIRFSSSSFMNEKSGVYFAPVGQILQVSHRRQTLRPRQGADNFATGVRQNGMPDFSAHSLSRPML